MPIQNTHRCVHQQENHARLPVKNTNNHNTPAQVSSPPKNQANPLHTLVQLLSNLIPLIEQLIHDIDESSTQPDTDLANTNSQENLQGSSKLNKPDQAGLPTPEESTPGTGENNHNSEPNLILYGDTQLGRVVSIDANSMQMVNSIKVPGENIYNTDQTNDENKSYVMARGSNWIDILERDDADDRFEFTGKIKLPFNPRTATPNEALGLQLVSSSDKPMYALIDSETDQVVDVGGMDYNSKADVRDFGGNNATGHASWLTDNVFVVPDRANRSLNVYQLEKTDGDWKTTLTDQLSTPTAVHNIENMSNPDGSVTYYATLEGSPKNGIFPSVAELGLEGNELKFKRQVMLDHADVGNTGLHHISESPDGQSLYAGSAEGQVYIIDRDSMAVTDIIQAGKGAGHVAFVPERDLALVVNHRDTFVTVIDTATNSKIKDVTVSGPAINQDILQSHTAIVSPDAQYYYNFATDNGTFFRIDLDTLEVDQTLYTGGTPKQGAVM